MTIEEQLREFARRANRQQPPITAAEIVEHADHGSGPFTTHSSVNGHEVLDHMPLQFTEKEATLVDLGAPGATEERSGGVKRVVMAGLLVAAAVVAIALLPIRKDDPVSPTVTVPPTIPVPPTEPPRALFGTAGEQFAPGTYFVDELAGSPTPRIFVTIGEGWGNSLDDGAIRNFDLGVMTFSRPVRVFADACHANDGDHPGPVTSLDGLVAALSEQGGWVNVTPPTDISVDGYSGKTFQRTAPDVFSTCTSGGDTSFRSFDNGGLPGGWEYYEQGEIETVRVFDVNGTPLMITSKLKQGHQDAAAVAGLAAVLDSIHIDRT